MTLGALLRNYFAVKSNFQSHLEQLYIRVRKQIVTTFFKGLRNNSEILWPKNSLCLISSSAELHYLKPYKGVLSSGLLEAVCLSPTLLLLQLLLLPLLFLLQLLLLHLLFLFMQCCRWCNASTSWSTLQQLIDVFPEKKRIFRQYFLVDLCCGVLSQSKMAGSAPQVIKVIRYHIAPLSWFCFCSSEVKGGWNLAHPLQHSYPCENDVSVQCTDDIKMRKGEAKEGLVAPGPKVGYVPFSYFSSPSSYFSSSSSYFSSTLQHPSSSSQFVLSSPTTPREKKFFLEIAVEYWFRLLHRNKDWKKQSKLLILEAKAFFLD